MPLRTSRHARRALLAITLPACLLASACSGSSSDAAKSGTSGAPGSSAADAVSESGGDPAALRVGVIDAPVPDKVAPAGSWAGAVAGTNSYLSVVSDGSQVIAYVCDSDKVSTWFAMDLTGGEVTARAKDGSELVTTLAEPTAGLSGRLAAPDGSTTEFTIPANEQALYRASDTYDEEGSSLLAGWIVLPDGTQRGGLTFTAAVSSTTFATTSTTTAAPAITVVPGATLTTSPVTVVSSIGPLLVTPTPITPIALSAGTANRNNQFVMVTLGDSYAAGEGAPNSAGNFDANGNPPSSGRIKETWSQKPPNHPEVEACHRSDKAAGPLVAQDLAADFPLLSLVHQSFACSGAKIENLIGTRYAGADKDVTIQVTPQIQQVKDYFSGTGPVTFPGTTKRIDALYMNIGGNDFQFAPVIGACIAPFSDCDKDAALLASVQDARDALDGKYEDLADRLTSLSFPISPGATGLQSLPVGQIYLSEAPNPMRTETGAMCATGLPHMGDQGGLAAMSNFSAAEALWVETNVIKPLNTVISAQSDHFTIVDTIAAASLSHGICSNSPWINNNAAPLLAQGKDARLDQWYQNGLAGLNLINASSGMVHPNAAGYRGMADEIKKDVRAQIVQMFKPATPGRLRAGVVAPNSDIQLRWDDLSNVDERHEIEERVLTNGAYAAPFTFTVGKNTQSTVIDLLGGPYTAQYRIRACGPKAGTDLCSSWSPPLVTSNVAPQAPTNVNISLVGAKVTATFTDNSGLLKIGGPAALVILATNPSGTKQQHTIQPIGTTIITPQPAAGLSPKGTWQVSLRACNAAACSTEVGAKSVTVT